MVEVEQILAVFLREGAPVIVGAVRDSQKQKHLERAEKISNEAYAKMKAELAAPPLPPDQEKAVLTEMVMGAPPDLIKMTMGPQPEIERRLEELRKRLEKMREECPTCKDRLGAGVKEGFEPSTSTAGHTAQDHIRYTKDQLMENLIALEDHFKIYRCGECAEKHLLGLRLYAKEGMGMTKEPVFKDVQAWGDGALTKLRSGSIGPDGYLELAAQARDFRRSLQGEAHLPTTP